MPATASAMNNASVQQDGRTIIRFESPDQPGAGIFVVPIAELMPTSAGAVIQVDYQIDAGQIYADLVTDDWRVLTQHPQSQGRSGSLYLYADGSVRGLKIMIGVQAAGARGAITSIKVIRKGSIDPVEFKRLRAKGFPFWYADADLGDGVFMPASIPPESMAGTRRSHAIMLTFLEESLGRPVRGLRGIDVGCSSGFHTIQLARLGAFMVGIDPFDHGLAQARFVEECSRDSLPGSAEFRQESIYTYSPEKPFDFIYCVGVLYHLPDPIGALRRLYDLCTIGGVIGCCVSPTPGDFFELSNATKYGFCQPTEFTLVPTASALRRCCEHVGFKLVAMADWSEFTDLGPGRVQYAPKEIEVPVGERLVPPPGWAGQRVRYDPKEIEVPVGPVYYALRK